MLELREVVPANTRPNIHLNDGVMENGSDGRKSRILVAFLFVR